MYAYLCEVFVKKNTYNTILNIFIYLFTNFGLYMNWQWWKLHCKSIPGKYYIVMEGRTFKHQLI
jgi:hypothetical protein